MGFLHRLGSGPVSGLSRNLAIPNRTLLNKAAFSIGTGGHGLPVIQLALEFQQNTPAVANPAMELTVLIDRSGSMSETFREGHVYNVASAILNAVAPTGTGFDLVFYDNHASPAGHISNDQQLRAAIAANPPRGGTYITETLRQVVQGKHGRTGLYAIVITDGEFADKLNAQQYIVQTLLPQLTPQHPYAFRLHFVGAGEEVDRAFLAQLEADASGTGIALVKHHHHTHLRHSHADILSELDRSFLGITKNAQLSQRGNAGPKVITRVGNLAIQEWREPDLPDIGFVPRRALLGLEIEAQHPSSVEIALRLGSDAGAAELPFTIPLPNASAPVQSAPGPTSHSRFHLPWHHHSAEDEATQAAAVQVQMELAQRVQEVRQAEEQRQAGDLRRLGSGGIPSMAQQRLEELGAGKDDRFTSDLTAAESALLLRNGYRPIGVVSGSAMYHVGQAYASAYNDCEVGVLSQAYSTATGLAVGRMQQEATLVGALGVVGVRFAITRHEWADKTIEVQLMGTAIAGPDRAAGHPWLSDLSGQEWWTLHRAGYTPAGFVYGHCAWFVLTTQDDEWTETSFSNRELTHMSQALGQTRSRAMQQLREQARGLGAIGVVGMHLSRRLDEIRLSGPGENPAYEREHHNLTLSLIGTALLPRIDAPKQVRATTPVLSLRDGRLVPYLVTTVDASFE